MLPRRLCIAVIQAIEALKRPASEGAFTATIHIPIERKLFWFHSQFDAAQKAAGAHWVYGTLALAAAVQVPAQTPLKKIILALNSRWVSPVAGASLWTVNTVFT